MPSRPRWRVDRWAGGAFLHQLVRICGRQCLARPLPRPLQMPWWYCGSKGAVFYLRSVGRSIISGALFYRALFVHIATSAQGALRSLGARSIGRSPFIGRSILSALCCAPHLSIRLSAFCRATLRPIGRHSIGRSVWATFYRATFYRALSVLRGDILSGDILCDIP